MRRSAALILILIMSQGADMSGHPMEVASCAGKRVAVVGSGITGTSSAWLLHRSVSLGLACLKEVLTLSISNRQRDVVESPRRDFNHALCCLMMMVQERGEGHNF